MGYFSELDIRLENASLESAEGRRIEAEFVAERANSRETAEWYARAVSGEVLGSLSVRCVGPAPERLSVTLRLDPSAPDGFKLFPTQYDYAAMGAGVLHRCRAYFLRLIDAASAVSPAPPLAAIIGKSPQERRRLAQWLWESATDEFYMVADYLEGRGITCAEQYLGRVIRWRWGTKGHRDAMVCAMRDVLTDEFRAAHVTPFDEDLNVVLNAKGQKDRRVHGLMKGAAIKLTSHDEVMKARALVIGEGLETCLSALQLGFWPVWAAGSTSNIYSLPVLPGIDELVLLGERDNGASERACIPCLRRWQMAGVSSKILLPKRGFNDFNDTLRAKNEVRR